jgi:transposase
MNPFIPLDSPPQGDPISLSQDPIMASTAAFANSNSAPELPPIPRVKPRGYYFTNVQRAHCLALQAEGFPHPYIEQKTGIGRKTQASIWKKAVERGFKPDQNPCILEEHVKDGERSGRPKVIQKEVEEALLASVRSDKAGREKSSEYLAYEQGISASSAQRILRKHGYNPVKPTRKPGLTKAMRKARLEFALAHEHWTLEDWKKVIWSDETSVVLGSRRGGIRLWRKSGEAFEESCIRRRWKGYSEFMFWGCFTWDSKGPCHIWTKETKAEKDASILELAELNKALEPDAKRQWELNSGFQRLGLRNKRGRKPVWRFTKKTGKLERDSKGGIDWYRYWKCILLPKLIPFALQCKTPTCTPLVQEDGAAAHIHFHQQTTFDCFKVARLLWPGNSPDLNAIEPCWWWMKKRTTARGAPTAGRVMTTAWKKAWEDLPQEQIQEWIAAIPRHIQEIIRLEGGNEYKEGKQGYKRTWAGLRIKGKLSRLMHLDAKHQARPDSALSQEGDGFVDEEEI